MRKYLLIFIFLLLVVGSYFIIRFTSFLDVPERRGCADIDEYTEKSRDCKMIKGLFNDTTCSCYKCLNSVARNMRKECISGGGIWIQKTCSCLKSEAKDITFSKCITNFSYGYNNIEIQNIYTSAYIK